MSATRQSVFTMFVGLRLGLTLTAATLSTTAFAKDVFLSIAGSVGVFRTDTRIFNPSGTKDITITATFLPRVGEPNLTRVERTITVPRRQMIVLDDVVSSLFQASGLGAIKLTSADDFVATSRIYAQSGGGTLGQFVAGLEPTAAKTRGVLIQLKSGSAFRTNIGFVNPNANDAALTIRQYNRSNQSVGEPITVNVPAMSIVFPAGGLLSPTAGDFGDAWIGYESNQPVFAFGSVVDNVTTDPTYISAFEDSGTTPPQTPSQPTKLYLVQESGMSRLRSNPPAPSSFNLTICANTPIEWPATLAGDMVGSSYRFSLGVQTAPTSQGAGNVRADIVLKRGTTETVLATTNFMTSNSYRVHLAESTGLDPDARAGDILLLRFRHVTPSALPCIVYPAGQGAVNFVEVPQTTVSN